MFAIKKILIKNKKGQFGPDVLIGFLLIAVLGLGGTFFLNTFVSGLSLNAILGVLDAEQKEPCYAMLFPLMGDEYIRQGLSTEQINEIPNAQKFADFKTYWGDSDYEYFSYEFDEKLKTMNSFLSYTTETLNASYYMDVQINSDVGSTVTTSVRRAQPFEPTQTGILKTVWLNGYFSTRNTENTWVKLEIDIYTAKATGKDYPEVIPDQKIASTTKTVQTTITSTGTKADNEWFKVNLGNVLLDKDRTYFIVLNVDSTENKKFHWAHANEDTHPVQGGAGYELQDKDNENTWDLTKELNPMTSSAWKKTTNLFAITADSASSEVAYQSIQIHEISGYIASSERANEIMDTKDSRFDVFRSNPEHTCLVSVYNPYLMSGRAQIFISNIGS